MPAMIMPAMMLMLMLSMLMMMLMIREDVGWLSVASHSWCLIASG
jgi:hypothetical protein